MSDQYVYQSYQNTKISHSKNRYTVISQFLYVYDRVPQPFFARELLLTSNITTDPHILANVKVVRSNDRYPKLKIYISELSFDSYEHIPGSYVTVYCKIWP